LAHSLSDHRLVLHLFPFFLLLLPPPPRSPLFPYTTLFRSYPGAAGTISCRSADGTIIPTPAYGAVRCGPMELSIESAGGGGWGEDRKSTRLNSSHLVISYAVFCLKKKKK